MAETTRLRQVDDQLKATLEFQEQTELKNRMKLLSDQDATNRELIRRIQQLEETAEQHGYSLKQNSKEINVARNDLEREHENVLTLR